MYQVYTAHLAANHLTFGCISSPDTFTEAKWSPLVSVNCRKGRPPLFTCLTGTRRPAVKSAVRAELQWCRQAALSGIAPRRWLLRGPPEPGPGWHGWGRTPGRDGTRWTLAEGRWTPEGHGAPGRHGGSGRTTRQEGPLGRALGLLLLRRLLLQQRQVGPFLQSSRFRVFGDTPLTP